MSASDAKKALRAATVGASKKSPAKLVKFGELEIELRAPKLSDQTAALARLGLTFEGLQNLPMADLPRIQAEALICCAYVPGTDEKVFEDTDRKEMLDHPAGSFVSVLGSEAFGVFIGGTKTAAEVGKGSEKTEPSGSASP